MKESVKNLHIVLVNPEIPQNTGNVGRTCVGLGIPLHLVGKLGFSLDSSQLKRAGLDYWPKLDMRRHDTWEKFLETVPADAELIFFSTHGGTSFWDKTYRAPAYLIFGAESQGLPKPFYEKYKSALIRIPVSDQIRSLNLATAVGVAAYEVVRQLK